MWLDAFTLGPLSCLLGLARAGYERPAAPPTANPAVTTNSILSLVAFPTPPALFNVETGDPTVTFTPGAAVTSLTVTSVNLIIFAGAATVGTGTFTQTPAPAATQISGRERDNGINEDVIGRDIPVMDLTITDNTVVLPFHPLNSFLLDKALYLEFQWHNATIQGSSFSPAFAFFNNNEEEASQAVIRSGHESAPVQPEGSTAVGAATGPVLPSGTRATVAPTPAGQSATETIATTPSSSTATEASSSSSSSSGGIGSGSGSGSGAGGNNSNKKLSTGDIAGIAVGSAMAVLLVGAALAWCLCLRGRRRGRSRSGLRRDGYTSDSGTKHAMMMSDKEEGAPALHANDDESAPQSAYGGNGGGGGGDAPDSSVVALAGGGAGRRRSGMMAAAPAPNDDHDRDRDRHHGDVGGQYAPYSDRAPSPSGGQTDLARTTTSQGQQGQVQSQGQQSQGQGQGLPQQQPTRYAHLVEEGMTADEIRQLEEEERQLDAAIEESGRSSSRR
ncbi:hypothetical protein GGR56DRAFT_669704 [Xylariaceae sp. FL0804]|nr:hypothetical protein GGR56DRAFT_669704 [Xylariaceae sp. FL0804]